MEKIYVYLEKLEKDLKIIIIIKRDKIVNTDEYTVGVLHNNIGFDFCKIKY